jgi:hypothetical protein
MAQPLTDPPLRCRRGLRRLPQGSVFNSKISARHEPVAVRPGEAVCPRWGSCRAAPAQRLRLALQRRTLRHLKFRAPGSKLKSERRSGTLTRSLWETPEVTTVRAAIRTMAVGLMAQPLTDPPLRCRRGLRRLPQGSVFNSKISARHEPVAVRPGEAVCPRWGSCRAAPAQRLRSAFRSRTLRHLKFRAPGSKLKSERRSGILTQSLWETPEVTTAAKGV